MRIIFKLSDARETLKSVVLSSNYLNFCNFLPVSEMGDESNRSFRLRNYCWILIEHNKKKLTNITYFRIIIHFQGFCCFLPKSTENLDVLTNMS